MKPNADGLKRRIGPTYCNTDWDNEGMKMRIKSKDFRVRPGEKVQLRKWPTIVKPFCESKKDYQELLREHVEKLSSLPLACRQMHP